MSDAIENPLFNDLVRVHVGFVAKSIIRDRRLPHCNLHFPLNIIVQCCETGQMRDSIFHDGGNGKTCHASEAGGP